MVLSIICSIRQRHGILHVKWHIAATDLALKFINNFSKFASNEETAKLAEYGPII